jgi:6-phosphogluconate dehydrogenase
VCVRLQNFALNVAEHGFTIAVNNRSPDKVDTTVARAQAELGDQVGNLKGCVPLRRPRALPDAARRAAAPTPPAWFVSAPSERCFRSSQLFQAFSSAERTASPAQPAHPATRVLSYKDAKEFVAALAKPRKLMFLVTAGPTVDKVIANFAPLLEEGDMLIDGGNEW